MHFPSEQLIQQAHLDVIAESIQQRLNRELFFDLQMGQVKIEQLADYSSSGVIQVIQLLMAGRVIEEVRKSGPVERESEQVMEESEESGEPIYHYPELWNHCKQAFWGRFPKFTNWLIYRAGLWSPIVHSLIWPKIHHSTHILKHYHHTDHHTHITRLCPHIPVGGKHGDCLHYMMYGKIGELPLDYEGLVRVKEAAEKLLVGDMYKDNWSKLRWALHQLEMQKERRG